MTTTSKFRMTIKGILKIIFFPFLFMVNPKVFYPDDADDEPAAGGRRNDSTVRSTVESENSETTSERNSR